MNSELILCNGINIDKHYNNVLSYSESDMLTLCRTNKIVSADDYQFLRPQNSIYTQFKYEDCIQATYIAFQNKDYSNKWFFAFVDDVVYQGENNTEIKFTVDAWSTWYSYWTKKTCYVERQHTLDDTIGKNLVNENIDVGEVIEEQETTDLTYKNSTGYYVCFLTNYQIKDNSTGDEILPIDKGDSYDAICLYNNNIFGSLLVTFFITQPSDLLNAIRYLWRVNKDGHIEDIKDMFILPYLAITPANLTQHTASVAGITFNWYTVGFSDVAKTFDTTIPKRTSFTGFTPKNNKCFVYPYNYLYVTNNVGNHNIYKYENFTSDNCVFENQFAITIGGSGRLVPKNYKGMAKNEDEALPLGKYPVCQWSSDSFTNWLTQNGVNLATSIALAVGSTALGVATGGATLPATAELGLSVAGFTAGKIGEFYKASLLPAITGGQPTGDVIWSTDTNGFSIKEMRVKTEFLRIIDDYFSKYGYAERRLLSPNLTGRRNWNYIEIANDDDIGFGEVPNNYMEEINNICRKGVTIWHNNANVGNYALPNDILT